MGIFKRNDVTKNGGWMRLSDKNLLIRLGGLFEYPIWILTSKYKKGGSLADISSILMERDDEKLGKALEELEVSLPQVYLENPEDTKKLFKNWIASGSVTKTELLKLLLADEQRSHELPEDETISPYEFVCGL